MKQGKSLMELAAELQRQADSKKDYVADTRRLQLAVRPQDSANPKNNVALEGVNGGMTLRTTAHQQMAAVLGIPKPYYDRLLQEAPDLLAKNVNHWLQAQPSRKLVRTLDNQVRAVLSDSYRPLDNLDLAESVLPRLQQLGARVESAEVTENRFYLKAVTDRVQGQVKVGDTIQAGVVVSNSEVGDGALRVEEMDFRLVCLNGMIRAAAVRKAHLGRGARGGDAIEDAREFFRDETRMVADRAFFMQVQDAVGAMFDPARFARRIEVYKEAADRTIKADADPVAVVEVTAKKFGFNDQERRSVLTHLLQGNDLSAWGLANSITRASQDVDGYDRASELEKIGGVVVELPKQEWDRIAVGKA